MTIVNSSAVSIYAHTDAQINSDQLNNSMMNFGFMPFGWLGWIFMFLWWIFIIAGIMALIKWLTSQSHSTRDHDKSPLEILKERYAHGEIDTKEFEEKKKDLVRI